MGDTFKVDRDFGLYGPGNFDKTSAVGHVIFFEIEEVRERWKP
jgi:hypothetical protein